MFCFVIFILRHGSRHSIQYSTFQIWNHVTKFGLFDIELPIHCLKIFKKGILFSHVPFAFFLEVFSSHTQCWINIQVTHAFKNCWIEKTTFSKENNIVTLLLLHMLLTKIFIVSQAFQMSSMEWKFLKYLSKLCTFLSKCQIWSVHFYLPTLHCFYLYFLDRELFCRCRKNNTSYYQFQLQTLDFLSDSLSFVNTSKVQVDSEAVKSKHKHIFRETFQNKNYPC